LQKNHKKIGVIIKKSSMMKGLASILVEITSRSLDLTIFSGPDPEKSFPKNIDQRPIKENIYFPGIEKSKIIYFNNLHNLDKIVQKEQITDLITTDIRKEEGCFDAIKNIHQKGIKTHYIQFYGDFLYMENDSLEAVNNFFVYGKEMKEIYKRTYPNISQKEINKIKIIGNPAIDFIKNIDINKTKEKYNLPKNKKIIVFFSTITNLDYFRKNIFTNNSKLKSLLKIIKDGKIEYIPLIFKSNYKDIIIHLKKWSDENNAIIILKTKIKHNDPEYLRKRIYKSLSDKTSWHPSMSLELISISDLVLSMSFSTTLESITLNKPSIQILDPTQNNNRKTKELNNSIIKNFKNTAHFIYYTQFIKFLKQNKSINSMQKNQNNQNKIETFFGPQDYSASKRLIDKIIRNM